MNRAGDWNCGSCQHLNFQRRESCQRCGELRSGGGLVVGPDVRPGDWYCTLPQCGAHNFASRSSCFKCGASKLQPDAGGRGGGNRASWKSGDWICTRPGCNEHNFANRLQCFRCNAPRDSAAKYSAF